MNRLLSGRAFRFGVSSLALCAMAVAVGCDDDDADTPPTTTIPADGGKKDGSPAVYEDGAVEEDAGKDATIVTDAKAEAEAAAPQGCAAFPGADFCDDFDTAGALTAGTTKWDFIEPSTTEQPVLTLSTGRAISAPNSLLSQIINAQSPGAQFNKKVTKASFTEATWEYDIYLESIGTGQGFLLDDFQFAANDEFGFRILPFAEGGAIKEIKVEHNRGLTGGGTDANVLSGDAIQLGKWHHFKQTVAFVFATDGGVTADGGAPSVTYTLTIDRAASPTLEKTYAGAPRASITFAKIAGIPFAWDKGATAGLKINWDNHVLGLK